MNFIALIIVWGLPLFISGLLLKGILDILIGRASMLLYVTPRAFSGGSVMLLSLVVAWIFNLPSNNVGWVVAPFALVISAIVSRMAETRKFLSGYLAGLLSLIILLWTSVFFKLCTVSVCVGFFDNFDTQGLLVYLGMPSVVSASGYFWFAIFYLYILFALLIGSSVGVVLGQFSPRKEIELSAETARATQSRRIFDFLPLSVFFLLAVIIFIAAVTLDDTKTHQRKQLITEVVIENFTEEQIYNARGERVLQISLEIKLPDTGLGLRLHYLGGFTLSTPVLKPEGYEREPGKPYLAITPEKMIINEAPPALGLAKGVTVPHQLNPGVNLINLEYIPDMSKVVAGPYQLDINVGLDGGRERITKSYTVNLIQNESI